MNLSYTELARYTEVLSDESSKVQPQDEPPSYDTLERPSCEKQSPSVIKLFTDIIDGINTAILSIYYGDETPQIHNELTQNDETQDIDLIL